MSNIFIRAKNKFGGTVREVVSTLDDSIETKVERMSGNTTRQVDYAIQQLFKGNIVVCLDHWENGSHQQANENLLIRVIKRMEAEHIRGEYNKLEINKNYLTVYIKTPNNAF